MSQTNPQPIFNKYEIRVGLGLIGWFFLMSGIAWWALKVTGDWTTIFEVQLVNIIGVPIIAVLLDDHERITREQVVEEQRKYLESPYHNLTEEERQQLANNNE